MSECNERQLETCQDHFEAIHAKLDRLDESIRGNGRPGILLRLDRLEQSALRHGRLIWMIVGAALSALSSLGLYWMGA